MKCPACAECLTRAKCRLPYIMANIARLPLNKGIARSQLNKNLTNASSITNNAKSCSEETMARPTERQREERLQIMLNSEELVALDDFRFKRRMPSRAAAVRELLKRGLAAEGFLSAAAGAKSSDYGVVGKTPPGRQ